MSRVPVIEQDKLQSVTVSLAELVAPPAGRKPRRTERATSSVGVSLKQMQEEHGRRAAYIQHIQEYVSGNRSDPPVRLEPNAL